MFFEILTQHIFLNSFWRIDSLFYVLITIHPCLGLHDRWFSFDCCCTYSLCLLMVFFDHQFMLFKKSKVYNLIDSKVLYESINLKAKIFAFSSSCILSIFNLHIHVISINNNFRYCRNQLCVDITQKYYWENNVYWFWCVTCTMDEISIGFLHIKKMLLW